MEEIEGGYFDNLRAAPLSQQTIPQRNRSTWCWQQPSGSADGDAGVPDYEAVLVVHKLARAVEGWGCEVVLLLRLFAACPDVLLFKSLHPEVISAHLRGWRGRPATDLEIRPVDGEGVGHR